MKIWLVMHVGYDFEPTTLAVCQTKKKAEAMMVEHYQVPANQDHPWNGCYLVEAELDAWVPYPEDGGVRSLGATVEDAENGLPKKGSLLDLAVQAGLIAPERDEDR